MLWKVYFIKGKCNNLWADAGDENLFSTLEKGLLQAIPADATEWRRSFGRPVKHVKLGAIFVPFSREILPTEKDWHLIKQPIFHIYWTECSVSTYMKTLLCIAISHMS
jgi:hypothetical protein